MTERIKDLITRLQEEHSLSEAEYAELITGRIISFRLRYILVYAETISAAQATS